ncbi:AAA family ATPase [Microbacterium sp.]|uniref:AAA family ATPase n=1 Tax=Microbacterium sp. TaxID=51671 RepID=UPI003A92DA1E
MEHFPIVKSLIRVALAQDSVSVRHQVERLAASLHKAGDADGDAVDRLLSGEARTKNLTPSRLTKSSSGRTGRDRMSRSVAVPVDRETSAPLAALVFPEDNATRLPIFASSVSGTIDALLLEWQHQEQLTDAGLAPSLSCLIYGPPGTGKTTLALWLAKQLGLPAVVARLDGLISSFLGTTARNLGALFDFADRYECVLILDEFDAIAKLRDDPNEVGEIKRVVNALLQNIDARAGRGITIGLTNHESLLDPAVWRRFEVQLPVPLPGSAQRIEIAKTALATDDAGGDAEAKLLAWAAESLSGAELKTMASKLRKQRVLSQGRDRVPAELVAQLAMSTSSRGESGRVARLFLDGGSLTRLLADSSDIKFSQSELAHLLGVSTKTIGRRISGIGDEDIDHAS